MRSIRNLARRLTLAWNIRIIEYQPIPLPMNNNKRRINIKRIKSLIEALSPEDIEHIFVKCVENINGFGEVVTQKYKDTGYSYQNIALAYAVYMEYHNTELSERQQFGMTEDQIFNKASSLAMDFVIASLVRDKLVEVNFDKDGGLLYAVTEEGIKQSQRRT